ncbi:EAL domain-containing protein [Verticiella sediminum]
MCLIDSEAHTHFSEDDRQNLSDLAALIVDRMEMYRLEHLRSVSQSRFENIAVTSPDAIICSDVAGKITFWNRSAEQLFGYAAKEVLHKPGSVIVPDSWRRIYDDELERLQHGDEMKLADRTIELSGLRKDGTEFPAELSLSTWGEADNVSVGAIVRDITERRKNEERLFRLASIDALTDLPNRGAWRACLETTLAGEVAVTVLLLDLDCFKEVNDTLGHSAGDAVLKEVAQRMATACDDAIMLARLGGDEFVALLPGNDEARARAAAERLVAAISKPYEFGGQSIEIVGVSIGIALAPLHGVLGEEVLGAADLALYKAKAAGKGGYEMFTPAFREVAIARRAFQRELRQAFENAEFELFYQPVMFAHTRRLAGAEALIRWRHPLRGLLTPASFIDVLSEKPSAPAIGEWIMRTACRQAAQWRKTVADFTISVNLFEAQLRSGYLLTAVQDALADTGLPADALELEIVENILLRDDKSTSKLLEGLRELGVSLAFDDYGTGFASLSLLKRYPVSRLKIDRSFIRNVTSDKEDAAVVTAIIYLCKSFGLEVIAEGVETESQLAFLRESGCPQVQGFLFGEPMPAPDFAARFL